jgi:hypothetical protein
MGIGWVLKSFDRARWDATFGSGAPGVEQKIVDAMLGWEDGYFDPDSDELRPGYDRDKILSSTEGKAARELASHLVNNGFTYDGLGEDQAVKLDDFGSSMWGPEGLADALDAKLLSHGWLSPRAVTELLFRAGQFRALQYQGGHPTIVSGATEEAVHAAWMAQRREMRRPASLPHTPVRLLQLLDWGVASQRSPDIARLLQLLGLGKTSPRPRKPMRLLRGLLDWGSPRVRTTGRRFGTEAEPTRGDSGFYVIFSPPELVELREEVEAAINVAMPWTAPEWLPEEVDESLVVPLNEVTKAGLWGAMTYSS